MNEVALVSANFGAFDVVKALPEHPGIDAFYYTDEPTRESAAPAAIASWTSVLVPSYPRYDLSDRLRSRYFKHQIHRIDEVQKHRWLVWCDGSIQLHETRFILAAVARLERLKPHQRVLLVPHPERRTVLDEYEHIKGGIAAGDDYLRVRYAQEKMTEQIDWFRARGWNVRANLYAGGFWIVENTDLFRRCWDDWWDQNLRFGMMDQLSLPLMLEQHHAEPQAAELDLWKNPHFTYVSHRKA